MATLVTIPDKKQSAPLERWKAISFQWRIVIALCFLLFMLGASILIRPDTTVNRNLTMITGIQSDFIAFFLWAMIPVALSGYYLWQNLISIMIAMIPVLAIAFLLTQQIGRSETAPLIHLVSFAWIPCSVVLFYYLSAENDEKNRIIDTLKSQQIAIKG